jgi:hypothetical protein
MLRIVNVTVDPAGWTAITPPQDCDNVLVSNRDGGDVLRLRTIAGDPASELRISAASEQTIAVPTRGIYQRFLAGAVAFYLKPDSGTGPVVLMWT